MASSYLQGELALASIEADKPERDLVKIAWRRKQTQPSQAPLLCTKK
jgi:hypothetical protein